MKLSLVTVSNDRKGILRRDLSQLTTDPAEAAKYRAEMARLCRQYNGAGLAANQAGLEMNMFFSAAKSILPVAELHINPSWTVDSSRCSVHDEGCLSLPGRRFSVNRPDTIMAEWYNTQGHQRKMRLKGFAAWCFQHECDHLRGVLLTDSGEEKTNGTR